MLIKRGSIAELLNDFLCPISSMNLMSRSHRGEGATMISANIEEWRQLQICQNSPKKSGKVWLHDKKLSYFYDTSTIFHDAFRLS